MPKYTANPSCRHMTYTVPSIGVVLRYPYTFETLVYLDTDDTNIVETSSAPYWNPVFCDDYNLLINPAADVDDVASEVNVADDLELSSSTTEYDVISNYSGEILINTAGATVNVPSGIVGSFVPTTAKSISYFGLSTSLTKINNGTLKIGTFSNGGTWESGVSVNAFSGIKIKEGTLEISTWDGLGCWYFTVCGHFANLIAVLEDDTFTDAAVLQAFKDYLDVKCETTEGAAFTAIKAGGAIDALPNDTASITDPIEAEFDNGTTLRVTDDVTLSEAAHTATLKFNGDVNIFVVENKTLTITNMITALGGKIYKSGPGTLVITDDDELVTDENLISYAGTTTLNGDAITNVTAPTYVATPVIKNLDEIPVNTGYTITVKAVDEDLMVAFNDESPTAVKTKILKTKDFSVHVGNKYIQKVVIWNTSNEYAHANIRVLKDVPKIPSYK